MLVARQPIATAITPHAADRSWIVFLQTTLPAGVPSPIKIAPMRGAQIGDELRRINAANAYNVQIIGLIQSDQPDQQAAALAERYAKDHLHDGWYAPSADLIVFIQHNGKAAIQELLAQVHPASVPDRLVDVDEMARIIGCSVPTVRRMYTKGEIPVLRAGDRCLFQPAEVLAAMRRR